MLILLTVFVVNRETPYHENIDGFHHALVDEMDFEALTAQGFAELVHIGQMLCNQKSNGDYDLNAAILHYDPGNNPPGSSFVHAISRLAVLYLCPWRLHDVGAAPRGPG